MIDKGPINKDSDLDVSFPLCIKDIHTHTHTAVCYRIDEVDFGKDGGTNRLNISWSLKAPPRTPGGAVALNLEWRAWASTLVATSSE